MLHAKKVWLIDNMVCHEGGLKKKKNNLCEASEKWNNSFIPSRFQGTPGKKLFLPHHRCTSPDKWHSQRWSCCSANQRLRSCSRAVPCLWPWTFLSPSFPEPGWPFCSSSSVERRVWHSVRGGSSTFETNIWLLHDLSKQSWHKSWDERFQKKFHLSVYTLLLASVRFGGLTSWFNTSPSDTVYLCSGLTKSRLHRVLSQVTTHTLISKRAMNLGWKEFPSQG